MDSTSGAERILGLDVGSERVGVALSDELGITAQPLETLSARGPGVVSHLTDLCREHGVNTVVVGLPLSLSGGDRGRSAQAARAFGEQLKAAAAVEVVYRDERFTTAEAERVLVEAGVRRSRRKQVVDKVAATLILQGYLDGKR